MKDPKIRHIHKACVKDRVLHHAIFRILYPIFDKFFIFDSYSSRLEKGTHAAIKRLNTFARKAGKNNTKTCWFLKCDVKKFFDSIDQDILIRLVKKKISDQNTIWLMTTIIKSFKKGIPLGNVTSQLFANIYLNVLDQFAKRHLKIKYYLRYCDDFVMISDSGAYLENVIPQLNHFLQKALKLHLHPNKIIIKKYHQGVDFLGYVNFPCHTILRNKTKKRMFKKVEIKIKDLKEDRISENSFHQTLQSYFGVLKHCNSSKLGQKFISLILYLFR